MQQFCEIDYDFVEDLEAGARIKVLLGSVVQRAPVKFREPEQLLRPYLHSDLRSDLVREDFPELGYGMADIASKKQ